MAVNIDTYSAQVPEENFLLHALVSL